MPISKIKSGGINDDAITNAKMADDAVNSAEIADNVEFSGTEAVRMPVGTTAQRANPQGGDIRFNSTTSLMEYYDGTQWKSIDSPPSISSISPSNIADSDSDVDIVVSGSNFITGGQTVTAIGADGSTITAGTVTRDSNTQLTANFDGTSFDNAQEPYDIKVENSASGLSITSADLLNVNASPAWTVSAGSLGTIYDVGRSSVSITTGATDSEGASLTYAVASGSLPSGLSIASSTGTITGTAAAVGSDTTSSFTLSVTDGSNTVTRAYSITVAAPVVTTYTSTGSGTFTVPSGVTVADVLVVAGGGSGGSAGGGGAGGLIYRPAFPVTPGASVSYTVGAGGVLPGTKGSGPWPNNSSTGVAGQDSVFGTLTAKGGGGGGAYAGPPTAGQDGGSGGGGGSWSGPVAAGSATQPQQPGDSGTYGFGNAGGAGLTGSTGYTSGGGGGAGAAGGAGSRPQTNWSSSGQGGIGKQYDISGTQYYYAGGGGGGAQSPNAVGIAGDGGQGGGGGGTVWQAPSGGYFGAGAPMYNGNVGEGGTHNQAPDSGSPASAPAGTQGQAITSSQWADGGDAAANSGGGGGGAGISVTYAGAGGSGIVIVKY